MNSPTEVWKPVPSEPGVLASSEGRVLLPPRHAPLPNGGYRLYATRPTSGTKVTNPKTAAQRYFGVMVYCREGGRRSRPRKVHQLVCEAFHGPRPSSKAVVMHLDENPENNRPENLRWGSQKENLNAPGFLAYCRSRIGECSPVIKHRAKETANV